MTPQIFLRLFYEKKTKDPFTYRANQESDPLD